MLLGIAIALLLMSGLFIVIGTILFFVEKEKWVIYWGEFAKTTVVVVVFGGSLGFILERFI